MSYPRALIHGGVGATNTGDLLLSAISLHDVQSRFGNSIGLLTPRPGISTLNFPAFTSIPYTPTKIPSPKQGIVSRACKRVTRMLQIADPCDLGLGWTANATDYWVKALQQSRLLYVTGGGTFMDLFGVLDYYLLPIVVAKEAGIPVEFAPNGFGPFQTANGLAKLQHYLSGLELVVRDRESLHLCKQMGLSASFRRDDGFRISEVYPSLLATANQCVAARSSDSRLKIGVDICDQFGSGDANRDFEWWIKLLRNVSNHSVVMGGFCFHSDPGADFSRTRQAFQEAGIDPNQVKPPKVIYSDSVTDLMEFDVILSSRFHAIVVANVIGRRTFAFSSGAYYAVKMGAAIEGFTNSAVMGPQDDPVVVAKRIISRDEPPED